MNSKTSTKVGRVCPQRGRAETKPREAYGVRGACSRFRTSPQIRKREQAPRTPYASRDTTAPCPPPMLLGAGRQPGLFSGALRTDAPYLRLTRGAFTLIELILVMTVLTIAISIAAPALANFFCGRTLDSEARRLLALTRHGQSRAVSEGLPMELWFDSPTGAYGLEAEPSYEPNDAKAVSFTLDNEMQLEVVSVNPASSGNTTGIATSTGLGSRPASRSNHPNLPAIRFLPDGTLSETSPQTLRLTGRDGSSIWLVLSRNHLSYEIRSRKQ